MATFAAAVVRWGCELPDMVANCRKQWPESPPDVRLWLDLYRDHRRVAGAIQREMLGGADASGHGLPGKLPLQSQRRLHQAFGLSMEWFDKKQKYK